MELRFQFNEHSSSLIPYMNVASDVEVNYLFELKKMHTTHLCMTLVRKNVVEGEHENSDWRRSQLGMGKGRVDFCLNPNLTQHDWFDHNLTQHNPCKY